MIKENYHTHTKRCGHAFGEDEEFVLAAIEGGLETLGFSDHVPYLTESPRHRMKYEELDAYIESILALKEKYKDQINILVGMELEYFPSQIDLLMEYRKKLDYCIIGQHNLELDTDSCYKLDSKEGLLTYLDRIETACKIGLCDYIAHPDLCLFNYQHANDETSLYVANRLADLSLTYNIPLEINCGAGLRIGKTAFEDGIRYPYPTRAFFEVFAKRQAPVILGLDVHKPKYFLTDKYIDLAMQELQGLNLNILTHYDIKAAADKRKANL